MKSPLYILLIAALLCASPHALAGKVGDRARETPPPDEAGGRNGRMLRVAQSDGISLSEAVEMVRRQYNGRIVSAETRNAGNREIHYIKVLTEDGKVKTIKIPGRSTRQP